MTFKVVLNKEFGGFHLTTEMVDFLKFNRHWHYTLFQQMSQDSWYLQDLDRMRSFEFRSNPDLVDCVEYLQDKCKNLSYYEKMDSELFDLKVEEITIEVEIYDHHDGKEKIYVHCPSSY